MSEDRKQPGEGDRESDRRDREHTQAFVESGKVDEQAEAAKPKDDEEAEALRKAEDEGRERAREKDPAVTRDYSDSAE